MLLELLLPVLEPPEPLPPPVFELPVFEVVPVLEPPEPDDPVSMKGTLYPFITEVCVIERGTMANCGSIVYVCFGSRVW